MSEPTSSTEAMKILLQHRHVLGGYILACVRNRDDSEDIYQEVWLAALKSLPQLAAPAEGVLPWVLEIARLRILEHWRKSKRLTLVDPNLATELAEAAQRIELRSPANRRAESLASCLAELPPSDQDLLERRYAIPFPGIAELASSLGLSIQAVYARLKRIRAALRKCANGKLTRAEVAT